MVGIPQTRFRVHMVNAALQSEVRCPLFHLVERLQSGGRLNSIGYFPTILSNSPGEVRLDSMVKKEGVSVDTGIMVSSWLLS